MRENDAPAALSAFDGRLDLRGDGRLFAVFGFDGLHNVRGSRSVFGRNGNGCCIQGRDLVVHLEPSCWAMITSLPALDLVTERLATRVLRDVSKDKQTYRGKEPVMVSHHAATPSAAMAAVANKRRATDWVRRFARGRPINIALKRDIPQ